MSGRDDRSVFWQVHEGLPRQAPGSDATTQHLLELAGPLPAQAEVLDVGCGPGRASLLIACTLPGARITCADLYRPYLDELDSAAIDAGVDDRVTSVRVPMQELPFGDGSFDLVWSEGAIYIMGFEAGLRQWRRLLRPHGTLVVTEATWFTSHPSEPARAFWAEAYPAMTDVVTNEQIANEAGYEVLATYRLPNHDWWDEYYTPLTARLDAIAADGDFDAASLAAERVEIDLHRAHGDEYGYVGLVLRRTA